MIFVLNVNDFLYQVEENIQNNWEKILSTFLQLRKSLLVSVFKDDN